jgi:membrane protease YdiL (CAAX protease family)
MLFGAGPPRKGRQHVTATDYPAYVAVGVLVAYMVLVGVIWRVTGTRYDALVDSRAHVLRGLILPIGLGSLLLAFATTWLGWWDSALFEDSRSGPGWALVVPALFAVVAAVNIATIDFQSPNTRLLPLVLAGCLLVGFAEELATRGLLVVGLREGGSGEQAVWLISSVLFSLLHAMNALFGQSARTTAAQLVSTFVAGTALYVTLMTTGTLIVGMVLHAMWDFGTLGIQSTGSKQKPLAGVLALVMFATALVSVWFVIAGT